MCYIIFNGLINYDNISLLLRQPIRLKKGGYKIKNGCYKIKRGYYKIKNVILRANSACWIMHEESHIKMRFFAQFSKAKLGSEWQFCNSINLVPGTKLRQPLTTTVLQRLQFGAWHQITKSFILQKVMLTSYLQLPHVLNFHLV